MGQARPRRRAVAALSVLVATWVAVAAAPLAAQEDPSDTSETSAPSGAPGEAEGGEADPALASVATCLRSSGHLLVAYLIDESNSLVETDPDDLRVPAAQVALDNLVSLTRTDIAGERPTVEAFVGAFARDYSVAADWGDLADPADVRRLDRALAGFADRDQGFNTDIPTALDAARAELAAHAAEIRGEEPCKLILFFTDGEYSLSDGDAWGDSAPRVYAPDIDLTQSGTADAAMAAGRAFECDAGGVADQTRDDHIVLLTAALTVEIEPAAAEFLEAITVGASGDTTCGSEASPEFGSFTPVDDVEQLVRTFNEVVQQVAGGTISGAEGDICVGEPCDAGRRPFTLEPPLSRATLLVDTGDPSVDVVVQPPGAVAETISSGDDGSATLAGADVTWTWRDDALVQIEATLPDGSADTWTGAWAYTLVAPSDVPEATPSDDLVLFTSWQPALVADKELVRGEEETLSVEIVDATGEAVDPASVGSDASVTATAADPVTGDTYPATVEDLGDGTFRIAVEVDGESSTVDLAVALALETASGQELDPQTVEIPVAVRAPVLFPALAPSELRLDSIRGTGATGATIRITAGADSDGCVWFSPDPEVTASPVERISVAYDPPAVDEDSCIPVGAGETTSVDVEVSSADTGEGVVRGSIVATLAAVESGDTETLAIPYSFDLAPPINEAERIGLFLVILLAGILAPILVLALVNRRLARFPKATGVVAARVPLLVERTLTQLLRVFADGEVAGDTVLRMRADGLSPGVLDPADFEPITIAGGAVVRTQGLEFHAHPPRNPFGKTSASVRGLRGEPVRAHVIGDPWADEHDLPLALPGTWIVVAPADGGPIAVTSAEVGTALPGGADRSWIRVDLVVFLAGRSTSSALHALSIDLGDRLSSTANAVADEVEGLDRVVAR